MSHGVRGQWSILPYCYDLVEKMDPGSALVVGVNAGEWGIMLHDYLSSDSGMEATEVPAGIDNKSTSESAPALEAVTANPKNIKPCHRVLYQTIHETAAEFIASLKQRFDLIVINPAAESMTLDDSIALARVALDHSDYVLINALCTPDFAASSFNSLPLVHSMLSADANSMPIGIFVCSLHDPAQLHQHFENNERVAKDGRPEEALGTQAEEILRKIHERNFELDYIKRHPSYRLGMRAVRSPIWRAMRRIKTGNHSVVTVRALGSKSEASQGCEVWLTGARHAAESESIPWDYMDVVQGQWTRKEAELSPYGQCYLATGRATITFSLMSEDPVVEFVTHPFSGMVEISYQGKRKEIDLYSESGGNMRVHLGGREISARPASFHAAGRRGGLGGDNGHQLLPEADSAAAAPYDAALRERWLERVQRQRPQAVAIYTPRWLGIANSTLTLFEHTFPFPHSPQIEPYHVSDATMKREADILLRSGIKHFISAGADELHFRLMCELKRRDPSIRCDAVCHGAYVRFVYEYEWNYIKLWIAGAQDGIIHSIGTVKEGMEKFFRTLGVRSHFLMNYVPEIPKQATTPLAGGPHLGLWMSGFNALKSPYTMIAAARMVKDSVLHGSNFDTHALDVLNFLGMSCAHISSSALGRDQLMRRIAETHLSLYVTFTECCPMLPLESFSIGVPCLVGPTSHLFEDDEYLRSRLVVPFPDRAEIIAEYIERAVAERSELVEAYIVYAKAYNARARASVEAFING